MESPLVPLKSKSFWKVFRTKNVRRLFRGSRRESTFFQRYPPFGRGGGEGEDEDAQYACHKNVVRMYVRPSVAAHDVDICADAYSGRVDEKG